MQDESVDIANKVRGVAAEKRVSQERIASILGISLGSVNARMNGKVPFSSVELLRLSRAFDVEVGVFFPVRERVA